MAGALRLEELSRIGHGGLESTPLQRYGHVTDRRGLIIAHQATPKYVQEQTDQCGAASPRCARRPVRRDAIREPNRWHRETGSLYAPSQLAVDRGLCDTYTPGIGADC